MNTRLRGKDFISMRDFSAEDLETILRLSFDLKAKLAAGEPHRYLAGKEMGMLFCTPSTRTRISFETAMSQLGGHAQYYAPEHLQLGGKLQESWIDTAEVMSRYLQGLVIRLSSLAGVELKYGEAHAILETMAAHANMPLICASSDKEHPCQAVADIMTIIEKFGEIHYKSKKVALVFARKRSGVPPGAAHSLIIGAATLGMRMTVAYPKGFDLDPDYVNAAARLNKDSGGSLELVHTMDEAVKDAAVIYAKDWRAIGRTPKEDAALREAADDWWVRKEHFDKAAPKAIFMHSMPLQRDIDVATEVVDGPMSVIYDEAENRLHVQKAIMSLTM